MIPGLNSNIKYVFVDCFDTLVLRNCTPKELFDKWFLTIANKARVNLEITKRTWEESNYIKVLSLCGKDEPSFRELVQEFYNRLSTISDSMGSFQQFYQDSLISMLELETANDYVNRELYSFLETASRNHVTVYCVSDFYLPKETVFALFSHLKLSSIIKDVYISSEEGFRKSTGRLYRFVLEHNGINPEEVLMIGDNRISDVKMAREAGIQSYHYRINRRKSEQAELETAIKAIFNHHVQSKQPYANYCFSLYLFCKRLHGELEKQKAKRVFFFSREGEPLKSFFDVYLKEINCSGIETSYLYVSRRSTYLPSLSDIDTETFDVLKKQYKDMSFKQFLMNLSLYDAVVTQTSLASKYEYEVVVKDFWSSTVFHSFIQEPEFLALYDFMRAKARQEILLYLNKNGVSENDSLFIVDIGWKGTIQDNLHKIIHGRIYGYYYGLRGLIDSSKDNMKYGLLFSSYPYRNDEYDLYSVNHRMLERVLYASHGSCLSYKDGKPVLEQPDGGEIALYTFVKNTQKAILSGIRDVNRIISLSHGTEILSNRVLSLIHKKFLMDPNPIKIKQQKFMDRGQKMNPGDTNNESHLKTQIHELAHDFKKEDNFLFWCKISMFCNAHRMGVFSHVLELFA